MRNLARLVRLSACLGAIATPLVMASPSVPDALSPPAGEMLTLSAHASGVQIYECKASTKGDGSVMWTLKAPEATLTDAQGKLLAKHYAGPSWESPDGSKVVGEVRAHADSPDANAIAWLLLSAKSHNGKGIFSGTTSIQRIDTQGGKAPATGCTVDTLDVETRIPLRIPEKTSTQ